MNDLEYDALLELTQDPSVGRHGRLLVVASKSDKIGFCGCRRNLCSELDTNNIRYREQYAENLFYSPGVFLVQILVLQSGPHEIPVLRFPKTANAFVHFLDSGRSWCHEFRVSLRTHVVEGTYFEQTWRRHFETLEENCEFLCSIVHPTTSCLVVQHLGLYQVCTNYGLAHLGSKRRSMNMIRTCLCFSFRYVDLLLL